jgi:hypothetical protein
MSDARFFPGQRVLLTSESHGLAAQTEGVVVGFYARDQRTVLVKFGELTVEIEPEALEPLDDSTSIRRPS